MTRIGKRRASHTSSLGQSSAHIVRIANTTPEAPITCTSPDPINEASSQEHTPAVAAATTTKPTNVLLDIHRSTRHPNM